MPPSKNIQTPTLENPQQEDSIPNTPRQPTAPSNPTNPTPAAQGIFIYGTLMAPELLSWLLTDSSQPHTPTLPFRQPALLTHYRRVAVNHSDYPALIPGAASDHVDGFLIIPASRSQRMKLDDFEGESYSWQCVAVELGEGGGTVRAHVYVWQGGVDVLVPLREWRFEWFRDGRLQDWLDLFEGMEMVGED